MAYKAIAKNYLQGWFLYTRLDFKATPTIDSDYHYHIKGVELI